MSTNYLSEDRRGESQRSLKVPLLTFSQSGGNFLEYRRCLADVVREKFGRLCCIIKTGGDYVYPRLSLQLVPDAGPNATEAEVNGVEILRARFDAMDPELFTVEADPLGLRRLRFTTLYSNRQKQADAMEDDKAGLYAFIWNTLSRDSQLRVQRSQEFDIFDHRADPVALWKSIAKIHTVSSTGAQAIDDSEAVKRYHNLRQKQKERLISFF